MERRTVWVVAAIVLAAAGFAASQRPLVAQAGDRYGYYYKGKLVSLTASSRLIAVQGSGEASLDFAADAGLSVDGLTKETSFRKHGLTVYRVPGGKDAQLQSDAVLSAALKRGLRAQPVFEGGDAVTIPSDEVLVGFKKSTTLVGAQRFLAGYSNRYGITGVRAHRPNTFIVTINAPSDGRAFGVSRGLSKVPGIAFAEPNLVFTMIRGGDRLNLPPMPPPGTITPNGPIPGGTPGAVAPAGIIAAAPNWQTLLTEGFETTAPGWQNLIGQGVAQVQPLITNFFKRTGQKSLYLTGAGAEGVAPPGPYPNNCLVGTQSPGLNLAGMEEAYVELWFWAKYEDPGQQIYDYSYLSVYNPGTGASQNLNFFVTSYIGDMTADPTTKSGWRRVLARIPPFFHEDGIVIRVLFKSDESNGAAGAYIDDVRVVGTTDVDTQPLGNDTYGGRAYELQNVGQLAALGNDSNDLNCPEAWAIQPVSNSVVVAVIDTGVDLSHPDLNLVTGYDADGSTGGAPVSADDNHGTSCAGNVGAKRNNSIGTIGTAPGVKIMPIYWGTTLADLATSIDVAVQHGAKVLSNSWGFGNGTTSQDIENAIDAALAANRIFVVAAGNGPDRPPYTYNVAWPGVLTGSKNVITVGATSPTDEHKATASSDGIHSWGSSYVGAGPDVCAPGPWSYTTDRTGADGYNNGASGIDDDYTHDFGGTSSSTPKVAGIVALMCSKDPNLTPAQVKAILKSSAKDIETAGVDDKTGSGRVDALKAVQQTGGGGNPTITVTSPNGGENWQQGTVHNITWTSNDVAGNVKIEVSVNGGGAYTQVIGSTANDGSHSWTVPASPSNNCRIRVSQASDAAVNDVSNASFTISTTSNPSVTVTTPNGGESWTIGTQQNINWDSTDLAGNVKIELSRNGGNNFEVLFASTGNDGTQAWTVAGAASANCIIRVSQASNAAVNDRSDAAFTIAAAGNPTATPTNLSANATSETEMEVTWTDNADGEDGYKVELRVENGAFQQLAPVLPENAVSATINNLAPATTYTVRVRCYQGGANSAYSNTDTVTTPGNNIGAPTNLLAKAKKKKKIKLTWSDNSNNEDGFAVEIDDGTGWREIGVVSANSTGAVVTRLKARKFYNFRVRARLGANYSDYSNTSGAKAKK